MLVSTLALESTAAVKRGYRLQITNLETTGFTYTIRYFVTPPDSGQWASRLNASFILIAGLYGDTMAISVPIFLRSGSVYVAATTFRVPANHTLSVCINPVGSPPPNNGLDQLEGYVTLELPVLKDTAGNTPFRSLPQAQAPVKVLLNPETTMVHTDTAGPGYTQNSDGVVTGRVSMPRLNFDTVEPLVPASGKAENEIHPNGLITLTTSDLVKAVDHSALLSEAGGISAVDTLSPPARLAALLGLLGELDSSESFVAELNKVLAQNHAPTRICRNSS